MVNATCKLLYKCAPTIPHALDCHKASMTHCRPSRGGRINALSCIKAYVAHIDVRIRERYSDPILNNKRCCMHRSSQQEGCDLAKITYIEHDGKTHTKEVQIGMSVMEGAVKNNVPGILAECGGACACATCHVFVDAAWRAQVGAPEPMELGMIEFAAEVGPGSRLACQIRVTEELDGLVVRLPASQG